MSKFDTVAIPFLTVGNRQILTTLQCVQNDWIMEFIESFPRCFEYDVYRDCYVYYPDGDAPDWR